VSTQIQKTPALLAQIQSDKFRQQVALVLPKHLTPERFTRLALSAVNRTPKLLTCTPESVLQAMMTCSQLGIEPDGRRAHLIPYGNQCQLIIDYKGLAELIRRSGEVSTLHADVVYEGDEFDYSFGTGGQLKHKPGLGQRGKALAAYSYVILKDGSEDYDVMSFGEIEAVRKKSRASGNGPWVDFWGEMAKKTVFRRHSKWLPLSPELKEKIGVDDEPLTEQERFAAAKTVVAAPVFTTPDRSPESEQPESQTEIAQAPAEKGPLSEREKLDALFEERVITNVAFENAARKAGYLSATETLKSQSEEKLAVLVAKFWEITK
jgi:recombination protein RecT